MFVKLNQGENYRGTKHEAGDVIEVGDDLGGRMILAGKASKASNPEEKVTVTAEMIDAMKYPEMKKLISALGIETSDIKMSTYSEALKAHFGV